MKLYDDNIEKQILAYALQSEIAMSKFIRENIVINLYNSNNKKLFSIIKKYYLKYNKLLVLSVLEQLMLSLNVEDVKQEEYKLLYSECRAIDINEELIEFYIDELKSYSIKRALVNIYKNGINDLESKDGITALNAMLNKLSPLQQLNTDIPITERFIYDNIDERKEQYIYKKNNPNTSKGLLLGLDQIDYLTNGINSKELVLFVGRTGEGKCHPEGTKVMLYDGTFKDVKYVQKTDVLMGPDSTPRNIISTTKGYGKIYKIIPNSGEPWYCNENHMLYLVTNHFGTSGRLKKIKKQPPIINISISDYLQKNKRFKHIYKQKRTSELYFNKKPVVLDPYFLGVLLSDGNINHGINITTPHKEIYEYCKNYVKKEFDLNIIPYAIKGKAKTYTFTDKKPNISIARSNKLIDIIQKLNLYVRDNNKFIPNEYKINIKEIRLQILAGLLDTAGSLASKRFYYISKSEQLAKDIVFICRSLGLKTNIKYCNTEKRSTYWRISISGNTHIIPTKLPHKKADIHNQNKNPLIDGFKIEFDRYDYYYGFELDKDHLYILNNFVITHNSRCMNSIAYNLSLSGEPGVIFSLEMYIQQLERLFDSRGAALDYRTLKAAQLIDDDEKRYFEFLESMKQVKPPLYLVDYPIICKPSIIQNFIKRIKKISRISWICIDYLSLMQPDSKWTSDHEKYGLIARELKRLAKSEDISIITATQLNRESIKSKQLGSHHISLSDMITHECDLIIGLSQTQEQQLAKIMTASIIKYRDGESKKDIELYCDWNKSYLGNLIREENNTIGIF